MEEDKKTPEEQPNNPLHGIKLADMLKYLEAEYGWESLGQLINIRCFNYDPSITSSLKFLRRTQWAKEKVEKLYLDTKLTGKVKPPKVKIKKTNVKSDKPKKRFFN
jgi:uncharacterized protein (DUF2132 family)